MKRAKVFGIGFHKTGTTSLAAALKVLGYRVTGPNWVERTDIGESVRHLARELAQEYDAFQDNPWPLLYREMDAAFPGSKFILTIRETEAWFSSVRRHFGVAETPMREWIYGFGSPTDHEAIYVERYERHNREVVDYFRNRPGDLLVMDMTRGHGWQPLCEFLGVAIPREPFPHKNAAAERENASATLIARLRSVLGP